MSHSWPANDCTLRAGKRNAHQLLCTGAASLSTNIDGTLPRVLVDHLEECLTSFSQHQNPLEGLLNMQIPGPPPMCVKA